MLQREERRDAEQYAQMCLVARRDAVNTEREADYLRVRAAWYLWWQRRKYFDRFLIGVDEWSGVSEREAIRRGGVFPQETNLLKAERRAAVQVLVSHLSPRQRDVIHWSFWEDEQPQQIARRLALKASYVAVVKCSALRRMREIITDQSR